MIDPYIHDNKEYFKVIVSRRGKNGKPIRRKATNDKKGRLISSIKTAERIEFELRKKVEEIYNEICDLTWEQWHNKCIERMRHTLMEGSVFPYESCFKKWLSPEWNKKLLNKITRDDVYSLLFSYMPNKERCTERTQKRNLEKISRIFNMGIEEGIISKNPTRGIKIKVPVKEKQALNTTQANYLLQHARECNHRNYYHWAFALFTGMRNGELYTLQWSDIDLDTGFISVSKQFTEKDGLHPTKSNRNRVVPISQELRKLIIELKGKNWSFSEKLFTLKKKGLESNKTYARQEVTLNGLILPRSREWRHGDQAKPLKTFCRNADIKSITFHELRATFITNLLSNGVSLAKVMSIVGHEKISTTNKYLSLSGVEIKENTTDLLGYKIYHELPGNITKLEIA